MVWEMIMLGVYVVLGVTAACLLLWAMLVAPVMLVIMGRPNPSPIVEEDWAMTRETGYLVVVLYAIGFAIGAGLALLYGIGYATSMVIA